MIVGDAAIPALRRRCCASRQLTQQDINALYEPPEFLMSVRCPSNPTPTFCVVAHCPSIAKHVLAASFIADAQLCTMTFSVLFYSSAMPVLLFLAAADLTVAYWTDRVSFPTAALKTCRQAAMVMHSALTAVQWCSGRMWALIIWWYPGH